ncbi:hypothetical protein NHQ30_011132 [Ciborinia camelliae]|nr:hypothetical protein NHQ30_011132 [Ciborinia camelliae]
MGSQKALVLKSKTEPLSLETVQIPTPGPGSVVVRVLGTFILSYLPSVLDGSLPYSMVLPMIPGGSSIGRVESVGADAVSLKPGQLVYCDITVRARDDPDLAILMGLHGEAAMKLMQGEWRNGTFAEYAKFPTENVFALDEGCLVPFGGLSDINLLPGETVIVAPATGRFGGSAVMVALAMGATVVACGRNEDTLAALRKTYSDTGKLEIVVLNGDQETDTRAMLAASGNGGKGADAYVDFSPNVAAKSTHIAAAMAALKPFGRAAFMGGIFGNIEINYISLMMKSLRIQGRFMYDREMVVRMIKMIEKGNLKMGDGAGMKIIGKYGLDEIDEAMEIAKNETGWGNQFTRFAAVQNGEDIQCLVGCLVLVLLQPIDAMAAPSRSSSYYGDMGNGLYASSFDDYQSGIDQSLDFGHVPSSDFYLGPEMFLIPQMLGEQPYPPQPIFADMTPIYDQLQFQSHRAGTSSTRVSNQTQLPPRPLDENLKQMPTEPRKSSENTKNHYAAGDNYYEEGIDENLEYSRKKRRSSEDKKTRKPSIPHANVFKLDLSIPSISQAESQPILSQESLSSVFEVNLNQQPKRKARSAFTPQGKKKVEAVRSVGACIQCNNYSKRITNFDVNFSGVEGQCTTTIIDGRGPNSYPLNLKVIEVQFSSLNEDILQEVCRITRPNSSALCQQNSGLDHPDAITILDSELFSSTDLEKWVMEYTYDNRLDIVNSTSFMFGVAYAKENLSHADLIENMTKLMALNYMLCNGWKIIPLTGEQDTDTRYPALRAQVDTQLFHLLYNAENLVCQELQRLVFKTSGQLPKDAVVPVALVLWLLTGLHSWRASCLVSLREGNDSPSSGTPASPASHQKHILNLLISVLTALFRSSFPLLVDFEDKFNRDLLGANEDLIQLSKKLRRDLIAFKRRGYLQAWKCNKGFLKEQVDRLRDVLTE